MNSGRLIDIPYAKSPPVLFTYRVTAPLAAGVYDFGGVTSPVIRTLFTPSRPILPNTLYLFHSMSFAMDCDQNDYQSAILNLPEFSAWNEADAGANALREPITLDKYFENYDYRLTLMGGQTVGSSDVQQFNKLYGSVTGVVQQTVALVGKASLTAIVKFTAQEVTDTTYIAEFTGRDQRAKSAYGPAAGQILT